MVDDDPQVTRLVARVGESAGFTVDVATNAGEAWGALEAEPRLLLLDLNLPEVDGLEMLRALAVRGCAARIHVFSGADARVVGTAHRLGLELGLRMGTPLAKPVELEALRSLLVRVGSEAPPAAPPRPPSPASWEPSASELERALEQRELFLAFQPVLDLATLEPQGAETLVRWRHPEHGVVPPIRFVPLAEQSGLVVEMTEQIVGLALAMAGRPEYAYEGRPLSVSVNLAPSSLALLDLPGRIANQLALARVAPERLIAEVTESVAFADRASVLEVLSRLRLRGVEVSIDDFGTGTSSLERVDQLPATELKIERAFVGDVLRRPQAAAIVRSTIELARRLELRVVAEGIEEPEILAWLREAGCPRGQGFLFARPLEPEAFYGWLATWRDRRRELGLGA